MDTHWKQFLKSRVRTARDGYLQAVNNKVPLKDILKSYNRWTVYDEKGRKDRTQVQKLCDETFGDCGGKGVYNHIIVFLDDEDVEEFDKQSSESSNLS